MTGVQTCALPIIVRSEEPQGLGGEESSHAGSGESGRVHAETGTGEDGGRRSGVGQGGRLPFLGGGVHGVEHEDAVEGQASSAQRPCQDAAPLTAQSQTGQRRLLVWCPK